MLPKTLTIAFLSVALFSACKPKETGPDLVKNIRGEWNVNRIDIWGKFGAYPDSVRQYSYHPADSGHIAILSLKKIDTHNVNVYMSLKRRNGALLYEYQFDTQVVQDINIPSYIYFDNHPGMGAGGYDDEHGILEVGSVAQTTGEYNNAGIIFSATR